MALDIVVQSLLRVELFAGLKPLQVAELARRSYRIVYKPGDFIIEDGAPADAAVLLIKGEAVRIAGPALAVPAEPVADGSLLGEMAMLVETAYSSTVIAQGMTRAIRITRDAVLQQIAADHSLADHLSHKLARRLDAMSQHLREIDDTFARADEPFLPVFATLGAMEHTAQLH